jgi:hypothetical protein
VSQPRTAKTLRRRLLIVLGVLGTAAAATAIASATGSLAAPTITAKPTNPTGSSSASFSFTGPTGASFECKLDLSSFSSCSSPKSYSGLSGGSHTFRVRAKKSGATSSETTYTWVIDLTAPTVTSINRAGPTPTNAASAQWTVMFSEAVKGVDAADFTLVKSGLGGTPAITGVTPNSTTLSASFTVTASTGTGSGTLGLNLVDNDSIVDALGNKLGGSGSGNGNKTGQVFTIDRTAPNAPVVFLGPLPQPPFGWPVPIVLFAFTSGSSDVASYECSLDAGAWSPCSSPQTYGGLVDGPHSFRTRAIDEAGNVSGSSVLWPFFVDTVSPNQPTLTQTPPSSDSSTSAMFDWTSTDPAPASGIATYVCKLDDGFYWPCSRPKTYTGLELGEHTFTVRAIDWAGNVSQAATYPWTIEETGMPFTIDGDADGLLYPGQWVDIPLSITNPNPVAIHVTALTVTVTNDPAGCPNGTNVLVQQSDAAPVTNELTVAAGATDWEIPSSFWPRIQLAETGLDQDACQGQSFDLDYAGSAHS